MSSAASGLALSIRKAEESETFDLSGQNVLTISSTVQSAFAEPLPLKKMIRITFVTGAGKQARQKYDEGAARAVTTTLRELGYEEDRAASCVLECAGTFKLQHDTGKNLKTVVVFPKINQQGVNGDNGGASTKQSLIPEGCAAHQIAMATPSVFHRMLRAKCPSWSQKKGCQAALERIKSMVDDLDVKLMQGNPLDGAEQDFYDHVGGLDDKLAHVKEEIHKQVESGGVTKFEIEALLEHNAERLASLEKAMKDAKGQHLEKVKTMLGKTRERREMLQGIDPKPPHKLKHEIEIARLWKEAVPLLRLEEQCKGRLLSVKETQAVARKDEIMEEIADLEEASRGWFEDDAAFDARIKAIRETFTAKLQMKPNAKSAPRSYAAAVAGNMTATACNDKWVVPGQQESKKNAWGAAASKKKTKTKGSDVFSMMMAKNDGDSDIEDNDEGEDELDNEDSDRGQTLTLSSTPNKAANGTQNTDSQNPQNSGDATNKKKNKKKNKQSSGGKKKQKDEANMSEDELLDMAAATANAARQKREMGQKEVSHPAVAFVKDYLIPFVLDFIAFLVSLLFGKPKQKQKKH